jgi:hypothetical protein
MLILAGRRLLGDFPMLDLAAFVPTALLLLLLLLLRYCWVITSLLTAGCLGRLIITAKTINEW